MTTDFSSLNLRAEIMQAITELGYSEPTPIQSGMIPLMLTGVDVVGQAQTGTGKTAAFALPILNNFVKQKNPQALVLAPTRELALQVADSMTEYGKHLHVRVLAVYGGQPYGPQINNLHRGVDIVVGTPGRLNDLLERKVLNLSEIKTVVLDEADEMLNMGFVEEVEKILTTTPSERQTAMFSATMPARIRKLADRFMRDPQTVAVKRSTLTAAAIEQRYYLVNENHKTNALTRLFEIEPIHSALVFARTRAETSSLANELVVRGIPAEAIHGDLDQNARERVLGRFRSNQLKVLVATDVAARGLDIDDISHVFNYHLPDDAEVYVHRIGRTGRAGKTGVAITLLSPKERRRMREVEALTKQQVKQMELPTAEDITKHREAQVVEKLRIWLGRGRYKRELEIVQELIDGGHDVMNIAAAAIKISRGDEKQRPIAEISEVRDDRRERDFSRGGPSRGAKRESFGRNEKPGRFGDKSRVKGSRTHEEGMIRLKVNKGKAHSIRPNDIVGQIAFHANIPGNVIGKIRIEDKISFVDVPEDVVDQVLKHSGNYRIGKEKFSVVKAQ
ncbi:MAG: DEAD/DEAH box helicase [Anaerolineales bacterium]|uniref:DEAD/DEAH box helicase n=1 Tax=Candidatus Villigracilis vicinus TaxID=3140679 RepID=UPI003136FACE|nr:DEAD/DEAH box helicase [Anaerolineales bacterium]MBK9780425.1 DEAD/DEAH box helicase [Anaerolineales bacterium]